MGFNTLQKGATVKDWIISELEEVIILGHKVPVHVRRGITALMMNPTFHATLLFFRPPGQRAITLAFFGQSRFTILTANEDTSDNRVWTKR
jgi:hypothetical protein